MKRSTCAKNAFTLIEISIVLVIIGLIVGGILTGRDLIHTAEIKSQIKQVQDYQVAFNTFRGKYNCIPGDCATATQFFGTTDALGNAINNGNNNGLIDTGTARSTNASGAPYVSWDTSTEMWGALQQLGIAQMIAYNPGASIITEAVGTTIPSLKLNPASGLFLSANYNFSEGGGNPVLTTYQKGENALWMNVCRPGGTANNWDDDCAIFTASDLLAADQKVADGKPLSGAFIGYGGHGSVNDCLNGTTSYKITNNTAQCQAVHILN